MHFHFKTEALAISCVFCVREVTMVLSDLSSRESVALLTTGTILILLLKNVTWDKPTSPAQGLYTWTHPLLLLLLSALK